MTPQNAMKPEELFYKRQIYFQTKKALVAQGT